ncbi:MAG: hypothetical protein ABIP03_06535 [Aquihabitans sp.]
MRRILLLTVPVLFLLASCGGSGTSKEADPTAPTTTTLAGTGGTAPATTTTVAEIDGDLLEPGKLPAPWAAATDTTVHTFDNLTSHGASASAVSCPASLTAITEGNTQCTAYADEGGPFASLTATAPDGSARTTLLCQSGGADSLDFTAMAAIDAPVAVAGAGAVDIDGRAFAATAYTVGSTTEWFVARRPAGQDCPVLWDLGSDDGTLAVVSALGGVLLPLVDGPQCVFVVAEGLRTRPAKDGICAA